MEEAIKYRAWQLGISNSVKLLGFLNKNELTGILNKCHLLLHPSLSEALSNSLLLAQAMGLPVVGSDVGGIPEVVLNKRTGFLVPPAKSSLISKKTSELLMDYDKWKFMSENAKVHIRKNFNPDKEIAAYQKLYSKVLLKN